ncbi:MAG TPA: preprotein translocase subunit SecG [Candidatus Hydrogenedentes bacterium]|nr:preprotein translocase subunit SecG [Candidatus Hydrogenedentota bacterium]
MIWTVIWWFILIPYLLACVGLIVIVLLQRGKGVGFAGAFGVGSGSDTIFGPRSSKSLPQKITYVSAGLFMGLALMMSMISGRVGRAAAPELVKEEVPTASELNTLFDQSGGQQPEGQPAESVTTPPVETGAATEPVTVTPTQVQTESGPVNVITLDPATGKPMEQPPTGVAAPPAGDANTPPSQ